MIIMTEHKLIMPKQTGQLDAFIASLKLFYQSNSANEEWYSNKQFKIKIQEELPYLSKGAQNEPYLVKQSELTRYFGLAIYDYNGRRSKITSKGVEFYQAYLSNNKRKQIDLIMDSIFKNSFGRNNTAIKTSDSNIDPPKLFIKSIADLDGITKRGLSYLLYVTHDLNINYKDAILGLSKTNDTEREIPLDVANKYSDVKFTILLTAIGVTNQESDGKYYLSELVINNYLNQINQLSIYNKEPDITLTLNGIEEAEDLNDNTDSETNTQEHILLSYAYDINGRKFQQQNNRSPQPYQRGNITRYKTNSRIAKTAIDLSNYKCLYNDSHETFISKIGKPYMEAHHLIPMAAQKDFDINIDRIENIVSLCPICHSAIHLGDQDLILELLKKIYDIKESELKRVGINISFEELFSKYYQ
jgi:hypothetical protein